MTDAAYISAFLLGLVSIYWAGFKVGTTVRIFKNLGTHA